MKELPVDIQNFVSWYIFDKDGNKVGVYLTIEVLDAFLEDLEDIFYAERALEELEKNPEFFSHQEVLQSMRDGKEAGS